MTDTTIPKLPPEAFPFYVTSDEEKERWQLAHAIATEISRQNEPSGEPNARFVWYFVRHVYRSDIPTLD